LYLTIFMTTRNQSTGDIGEQDVVDLVPCPNCLKPLMILPKNYPLYDVQCTGCSFRAQIKTISDKPQSKIRGAGWDIMEKVLKSGYMIPPLFINFKWKDKIGTHQQILFYPFIPKSHLEKRQLPSTARRANYKMFNYVHLDRLPYFVVCAKTVDHTKLKQQSLL